MTAEEYINERLNDQITWYSNKSQTQQRKFKTIRIVEIIAAALIPFLSVLSVAYPVIAPYLTITVGVLGMIIAVISGVLSLGHYQEQWIEYRTICESLKKEKFLFSAGAEPYSDENSFNLLVQRVETLISKENANWSQYMTKPQQEKKDGKS